MRSPLEIALLVLVLAVIGALVWPKNRPVIDSAEAHRLVEQGAVLLDVRTPEEFARSHLPGAKNLPVGDLEGRLSEVGEPDRPVVVYCRSGARSARARETLLRHGFSHVSDLGAMSRY